MKTNQLEGFLIVSADRFPFIKEELGDKVEILKEYESEGKELIQFHIKIGDTLDLLSLFHAGVSCGCKEMITY